MHSLKTTLYALGLGAGLMYWYDPDQGRRRRALLRDKAARAVNRLDDALEQGSEDLRNRARGLAAETRARLRRDNPPDWVLAERARAALGRVTRFPGAIHVRAHDGHLTLTGDVLKSDVERLLTTLSTVRGVKYVEHQMQEHASTQGVSSLQGSPRRREPRPEPWQENWSPAMRLLSTAGGGLLGWYGLRRGGPLGLALGAGGAGLALRGLTNLPPKRLFGYGGGRQAVEVQKSINIYAPVEDVYALWADFTKFPRFMARVRDVRDLGDGRSHWQVTGPAGATVEWDAIVTKQEPNRLLAWKSVEGEAVQSAGLVRFDANPDGTTRVTVRLAYNPPAGAVGHAVASLFGADPKRAMDEDLVRLKSLLETGKTTAEGVETRRETLGEPYAARDRAL